MALRLLAPLVGLAALASLPDCRCGVINPILDEEHLEDSPIIDMMAESSERGVLMAGKLGECDDRWGRCYRRKQANGKLLAEILCYSESGLVSGFGARTHSQPPKELVEQGYWIPAADEPGAFDLIMQARTQPDICTVHHIPFPEADGPEALVVNGEVHVPAHLDHAQEEKWTEGTCFMGQGAYFSKDLSPESENSGMHTWEAHNLLPVQVAFNPQTRQLSAVKLTIVTDDPIDAGWKSHTGEEFCSHWCQETQCDFVASDKNFGTLTWTFDEADTHQCVNALCVEEEAELKKPRLPF